MKYKAIFFDLDNTLYDYKSTHTIALEETLEAVQSDTKIPISDLSDSYNKNRKSIHRELHGFGSSHSRLLYLQRMLEDCELGYAHLLRYHSIYWDTFIENVKAFDGVEELFRKISGKIKVGIITDLTAEIQFRKLISMKLLDKIDVIVTSEEAGNEKPHPYIFHLAERKMKISKDHAVYFGDDFEKDVLGATTFGMDCIWLNRTGTKQEIPVNCREITEFPQVFKLIEL